MGGKSCRARRRSSELWLEALLRGYLLLLSARVRRLTARVLMLARGELLLLLRGRSVLLLVLRWCWR